MIVRLLVVDQDDVDKIKLIVNFKTPKVVAWETMEVAPALDYDVI